MTAHTPGPWVFEPPFIVNPITRRIIASIGSLTATNDDRANAALFCAAPDTLTELTALADWVEEFALPAMGDNTEGGTTFLASARAAIAKTTGGKTT